jgi:hypothetical protein
MPAKIKIRTSEWLTSVGAKDITDYLNVKLLDKLKQDYLNADKSNKEPLK